MAIKWKRSVIRLSIAGAIIALGSVGGLQLRGLFVAQADPEAEVEGEGEPGGDNKAGDKNASDDNPAGENGAGDNDDNPPAKGPSARGTVDKNQPGAGEFEVPTEGPPNSRTFGGVPAQPPAGRPYIQKTSWDGQGEGEVIRANDDSDFSPASQNSVDQLIQSPPSNQKVPPLEPGFGGRSALTDSPPPTQPSFGSGGSTSFSDNDNRDFGAGAGPAPVTSTPVPLSPASAANATAIQSGGNNNYTRQFSDSPRQTPIPATPPPVSPSPAPRFSSSPPTQTQSPQFSNSRTALNDTRGGGAGFNRNSTPSYSSSPVGAASSMMSLPEGQISAQPGAKELEGMQTPTLALEKVAPAEVQVGRPAMFQLKVRNVGTADANSVTIWDRVPKGTQFVDASPEPIHNDGQVLIWNLNTLKSGAETTISMQLIPTEEGELGSVATVSFQSQAAARTICTKPVLVVEHSVPKEVLIGQSVTLDITVKNTGTGLATGVIVEEEVPEQLSHPAGTELEYDIGKLQPGESKKFQLILNAKQAGKVENILLVRADGNLLDEDRQPLEVIAPQLNVRLDGPKRRYLERQATYTVSVENPGTAKATNVDLVARLPKGLKFVRTNNQGQYDPNTHAVYWSLAELPANQAGEVELQAIPIEMGEQKLRVEGKGDLGISDELEQPVVVEGLAAIFFGVADTADPIEVGSDTVYEVKVVNQGSKTATNVRVAGLLPNGLKPIGGDGPTTYQVSDQTIYFEPLARLAPKDQAIFKIQARGVIDGDHRITVRVATDEVQTPVAKEESTRVYSDR